MKLTDEEKTRRLAEGVMGWKVHFRNTAHYVLASQEGKTYDRAQASVNDWQPLTNESNAAEVRERMRVLGWDIQQSCHADGLNWTSIFKMEGQFLHGNTGSLPQTLCHASLLALGLATEEEL